MWHNDENKFDGRVLGVQLGLHFQYQTVESGGVEFQQESGTIRHRRHLRRRIVRPVMHHMYDQQSKHHG